MHEFTHFLTLAAVTRCILFSLYLCLACPDCGSSYVIPFCLAVLGGPEERAQSRVNDGTRREREREREREKENKYRDNMFIRKGRTAYAKQREGDRSESESRREVKVPRTCIER